VLSLPAAEALDRVAEEQRAGLVVVGSRGRSKLGSVLHGSVPTRLAAEGSTVLVVLPPAARLEPGSGHYECAAQAA
jgi:nucleotide-binding universal stress UspA family protein